MIMPILLVQLFLLSEHILLDFSLNKRAQSVKNYVIHRPRLTEPVATPKYGLI